MKSKVQAQRKFAQGAYNPPTSGERRSDVGSSIPNIDTQKQNKNIMCSNMSAATLLDLVSMKNLVPEMIPVVLVERLPESVKKICSRLPLTNNSQKELPKVPSLVTRNREPPTPLLQPLLKKKKNVRGNLRGVIQLRSKTILKKMPVTSNIKRVTKNKIVKKRVALNRTVLVTKKHPVRNKSPITSGFSTDDDTPLNQVSQKRSNVTLRNLTTTSEINELNNAIKDETEPQLPIVDITLENTNMDVKSEGGENFYDRNEIERWINDSHSSSSDTTQPQELHKNSVEASVSEPTVNPSDSLNLHYSSESSVAKNTSDCCIIILEDNESIPENLENNTTNSDHTPSDLQNESSITQDTFKMPRPINLSNIYNSKDIKNLRQVDESNNLEKAVSECPSSNFLTPSEMGAVFNDRNITSKFCVKCPNCKQFSQLAASLRKSGMFLNGISTSYLNANKNNDVYVFDDNDSTTQSVIEFRQNRRKSKDDTSKDKDNQVDLAPITPSVAAKNKKITSEELLEEPQPSLIISQKSGKLLDAPVYHPTQADFVNPFKYIEKIEPIASKFGMCKIVAPKGFKPECIINKSSRFTASNQYPAKMFSRWGSSQRELCAIKTHSATQKVRFVRPPLLDGVEVDLVKLFHTVQIMGGLINVINKELWQAVAEKLGFPKSSLVVKKLDQIYVKYILPYDTLTDRERLTMINKVEKEWANRYKRMLVRARNPLHKQKQLLGDSSSDEDEDDEDPELALDEVDDCIVIGRIMTPASFEKVAQTVMQMHFGGLGRDPTPQEVEAEYWQIVVLGDKHVSVNTAAIDTGEHGYGFTRQKGDKYAKHPWNLKVMSNSAGSALRSLGPVLSVTVPTLHLGMVFSTSCWHRDPHGLPWIEYMHGGPPKIWYGIPDKQSDRFRRAVEVLCPAFCQNKSIWLPSDILMIPPNKLIEHDVSLSTTVQNPGEFIIIFPKAYSCSICTGYTVSESVYFAPSSWLSTVKTDFQEVRDSFEPTMFSLEQLLIAMANDSRVPKSTLPFVYRPLDAIVNEELENRRLFQLLGVEAKNMKHPSKKRTTPWNVRELAECNVCRMTLYLSQVTGIVDKKLNFCLQHALRILETPGYVGKDISGITLTYFYTDEALGAVITKLETQLLKI